MYLNVLDSFPLARSRSPSSSDRTTNEVEVTWRELTQFAKGHTSSQTTGRSVAFVGILLHGLKGTHQSVDSAEEFDGVVEHVHGPQDGARKRGQDAGGAERTW